MKFQKMRVKRGRKPIGWRKEREFPSEFREREREKEREREREGGPTEKLEELFESEIERDAPGKGEKRSRREGGAQKRRENFSNLEARRFIRQCRIFLAKGRSKGRATAQRGRTNAFQVVGRAGAPGGRRRS